MLTTKDECYWYFNHQYEDDRLRIGPYSGWDSKRWEKSRHLNYTIGDQLVQLEDKRRAPDVCAGEPPSLEEDCEEEISSWELCYKQ